MAEVVRSQLAHVELVSPRPEETVWWIIDVVETTREWQSVYLRGWAEWLQSSLIVTEGAGPALGHVSSRAYGAGDPERLAERLEDRGLEIGWVDSSVGHGSALRYHAPVGGHVHEGNR